MGCSNDTAKVNPTKIVRRQSSKGYLKIEFEDHYKCTDSHKINIGENDEDFTLSFKVLDNYGPYFKWRTLIYKDNHKGTMSISV